MTSRRVLLSIGSFALGLFLIAILVKAAGINLQLTLQQIRKLRWMPFTVVMLLNIFLVLVSTVKWRAVDAALRDSSDTPHNRLLSFALTSAGLAIGTFVPVQIAMSTTRTVGTRGYGSALKRGTAGTLYEQSFDVVTTGLLAVASIATWAFKGGMGTWISAAVLVVLASLFATGPTIGLIRYLSSAFSGEVEDPKNPLRTAWRKLAELLQSESLGAPLARRLVLLSCARFIIVTLMSVGTASAVGLHIPFWRMAAAIPFVTASSFIALTPGGLGINEISSVAGLRLFGTSLAVGGQWALANRILITISYLIVAFCAAVLTSVMRLTASADHNQARGL